MSGGSLGALAASLLTPDLAIAAAAAFLTSILGGLTGFGVGLVLPVALAPIVGIANVIPCMAIGMLLTNGGRVWAFWRDVERRVVLRILVGTIPAALASASVYTLLPERAIAGLLGVIALAMLPLRRALEGRAIALGGLGFAGLGLLHGAVAGAASGTGIILVGGLLAAGLTGSAVIATDAAVAFALNLLKIAVFGTASLLDQRLALIGAMVGLCTIPGAFVARWLLGRMPMQVHVWMLEAIVAGGGVWFLYKAFA